MSCPWCQENGEDMRKYQLEWTVIDDDFAQPISPKLVHFCFSCGRLLDEKRGAAND